MGCEGQNLEGLCVSFRLTRLPFFGCGTRVMLFRRVARETDSSCQRIRDPFERRFTPLELVPRGLCKGARLSVVKERRTA